MKVAALYDIHGNLPALEAVLYDVRQAEVDQIVVGGDVVPGPMPGETLRRLLELDIPVQFIHGNGELAALAQMAARDGGPVTYWGTASGAPPPNRFKRPIVGRRSSFNLNTNRSSRAGPKQPGSRLAGWARCCFATVRRAAKRKSLPV